MVAPDLRESLPAFGSFVSVGGVGLREAPSPWALSVNGIPSHSQGMGKKP